MLLRLALPLAAQEVNLCPENPPEDHFNFVNMIEHHPTHSDRDNRPGQSISIMPGTYRVINNSNEKRTAWAVCNFLPFR